MVKLEPPVDFLEAPWWDFFDEAKGLLVAERWQGILMDCSKNELLVLIHIYRSGETTMSRIADYVGVPLNTATGIANRLEQRKLVERWRSEQDKRVVEVRITEQGAQQISEVLKIVGSLIEGLLADLNEEEYRVLLRIMAKVPQLLAHKGAQAPSNAHQPKGMRRIAIE